MYKLITTKTAFDTNEIIHRLIDNTFIPFDPDNTDYQAYLAWVAQGNTPLPAEETL
jgi:hypothetical protein